MLLLSDDYLFATVDIDTWGGWTASDLEALQCVPLCVSDEVFGKSVDARRVVEVDDEGFPRCADDGIAVEGYAGADGGDGSIDGGTYLHVLSVSLTGNEQVVESARLGGNGSATTLFVDEGSQLGIGHGFVTLDELDDH